MSSVAPPRSRTPAAAAPLPNPWEMALSQLDASAARLQLDPAIHARLSNCLRVSRPARRTSRARNTRPTNSAGRCVRGVMDLPCQRAPSDRRGHPQRVRHPHIAKNRASGAEVHL